VLTQRRITAFALLLASVPVASVLASFGGGSDGMGAALPILLLVSLAGAAGYALARLRHRDR